MYAKETKKMKFHTKEAIGNAFIELINEREYEKITITDICKGADIVRKTFYNNFSSKDDVVRYLINSIFDEMESRVDLNSLNIRKILLTLFSFIMENKESLILFYNRGLIRFAGECIATYAEQEQFITMYDKYFADPKAYKYVASYISAVLLSVVETWIKNNFTESIEFLAEITEALMDRPQPNK